MVGGKEEIVAEASDPREYLLKALGEVCLDIDSV
jgi:hypothetical protein